MPTHSQSPSDGHVVVRQSEDWDEVFVASPESAIAGLWTLAFARPNGALAEPVTMGPSSALAQLKSARVVELDGRLEPPNAAALERLARPEIVRITNASRGPRSSLSATTLVVGWCTSSSYTLPDLRISASTSRLVVEVTDIGGPISPSNRRWLPDLPDTALPVPEVVLDFSRWSHSVVDPFTAAVLYRTVANLLVRGVRVVVVDFDAVFRCMADPSFHREMDDTRWTALPVRAENGVKFYILEQLTAAKSDTDVAGLKGTVRGIIGRLSLLSLGEYARLPPPKKAKL